jgi:hypothetical protein
MNLCEFWKYKEISENDLNAKGIEKGNRRDVMNPTHMPQPSQTGGLLRLVGHEA